MSILGVTRRERIAMAIELQHAARTMYDNGQVLLRMRNKRNGAVWFQHESAELYKRAGNVVSGLLRDGQILDT